MSPLIVGFDAGLKRARRQVVEHRDRAGALQPAGRGTTVAVTLREGPLPNPSKMLRSVLVPLLLYDGEQLVVIRSLHTRGEPTPSRASPPSCPRSNGEAVVLEILALGAAIVLKEAEEPVARRHHGGAVDVRDKALASLSNGSNAGTAPRRIEQLHRRG